jgi:hypothetical protein
VVTRVYRLRCIQSIHRLDDNKVNLILENVRSFARRHVIPIKPLTILTGENSSGKTTLLGMFSILCQGSGFPLEPQFNREPYSFGNYETIATYKGGKGGRAKYFRLGYERPESKEQGVASLEVGYISDRRQVSVNDLEAKGNNFELSVKVSESTREFLKGSYNIRSADRKFSRDFQIPKALKSAGLISLVLQPLSQPDPDFGHMVPIFNSIMALSEIQALSIAPIRTRPERVYSNITEAYRATGDHIPYLLAQVWDNTSASERDRLFDKLADFGEESGLFSGIYVRPLGAKAASAFQLMVKLSGSRVNIVDVGYGVSQVLPIIVQGILSPGDQFLLLQQPEVHLHPRAQAALGTFFAGIAASAKEGGLIIETHSDYLIDRVRQEVAKGALGPDQVAILYLYKKDKYTTCDLIEIDMNGNLVNAPAYYREFFLKEELQLLTRASGR